MGLDPNLSPGLEINIRSPYLIYRPVTGIASVLTYGQFTARGVLRYSH